MPNHTENILRVTGPKESLAEFESVCRGRTPQHPPSEIEKRHDPDCYRPSPESCMTFSGICPVPHAVIEAPYDPVGYNWRRENWGTKWDAYGDPELLRTASGDLVYIFQTAWAPPRPWLRAASLRFTDLTFELFARDEYPYCVSILAQHIEGEPDFQECYGERREEIASPLPSPRSSPGEDQ